MAKMNLPAVLKSEHNLPNDSAAAIRRDCGFEMQSAMSAIRAGQGVADRGRKWLGALCAKWRRNPRKLRIAAGAKIFARLDILRANRAGRRVKQRRNRAEKLRV